jgi:hypothetical protein
MSVPRVLGLAACMVLLVVAIACSGSGAPPPPPPAPTPLVARTVEEIPAELRSAYEELANIKTARADVTIEARDDRRYAGFIEFEAPDRLSVGAFPESNSEPNFAVIGFEYFLRIGRDWFARDIEPYPTPDPQATPVPVPEFTLRIVRGGSTTVEGKRCELFTFPVGPELQGDLSAGTTIELCLADNRVQRLVWKDGVRIVTAIFQYDIPVNIERPTTE